VGNRHRIKRPVKTRIMVGGFHPSKQASDLVEVGLVAK
jgi:hypothetical protein